VIIHVLRLNNGMRLDVEDEKGRIVHGPKMPMSLDLVQQFAVLLDAGQFQVNRDRAEDALPPIQLVKFHDMRTTEQREKEERDAAAG
jgi:hypothetical protein